MNFKLREYPNKSRTFIGSFAKNVGTKERPVFTFPGIVGMIARYLYFNLIGPKPPGPKLGSKRRKRYLALRAEFVDSNEPLMTELSKAFLRFCVPQVVHEGIGRMGKWVRQVFPGNGEPPAYTFLELVRGGSWATQVFLRELRKYHRVVDDTTITACGQREGEKAESLFTDQMLKGYVPDLDKRVLVTFDPILATAISTITGIENAITRCNGKRPMSIIVLFIHATRKGIRKIALKYPGVTIIALAVHKKLTLRGFLDDPGVEDYGSVLAGCLDKKPEKKHTASQRRKHFGQGQKRRQRPH